jgi:O-antigen ligase
LQNFLNGLTASIPALARIELLFTDFSSAFSENGSGRNITWKVALQLIQLSPVIGIGIGTYSNIAIELFHQSDISHNTFLQLSAEWGIPLAFIFFIYVFFILGSATFTRKPNWDHNLILRDIIIILLIGSMAISLNNARILWLVLGALVSSLNRDNIPRGSGD